MASISDYRKEMRAVEGWEEAAELISPNDVKAWNADARVSLAGFKTLVKMSVEAPIVRASLFTGSLLLQGYAEALSLKEKTKDALIVASDQAQQLTGNQG